MSEIRRHYVQNGKKIETPNPTWGGLSDKKSTLTDQFCQAETNVFGGAGDFASKGGMKSMGESLNRGVVLVMSIWDDGASHMLWLDGDAPADADPYKPGVKRGPCDKNSGNPSDTRQKYGNAHVRYSNVKVGPINTTAKH